MLVTGSYLPFLWGWAPSLTTLAGVGAGLPLSQPRSGQARPRAPAPPACPVRFPGPLPPGAHQAISEPAGVEGGSQGRGPPGSRMLVGGLRSPRDPRAPAPLWAGAGLPSHKGGLPKGVCF